MPTISTRRSPCCSNLNIALKRRIRRLIDDTFKGRCDDFEGIHTDQVAAQGEMEGFVRKMMAQKDLNIDESLELQVDPDKRKRPQTVEERDAIRRKLLHFQLANYFQYGTKLDEAKKRLTHRYELSTKLVGEMTTADIYANYLNAFAAHSTHTHPIFQRMTWWTFASRWTFR